MTPKPCRFCGSTDAKLTKEHLWPDWVRELFPEEAPATHTLTHRGPDSMGETSFSTTPFTLRKRLVCASCNNGWMSDIEGRMASLAGGMILGRGRLLHPAQQSTVAAWATLKAFVFHSLHPVEQQLIPDQHYKDLYDLRDRAPTYVRVFLARYDGERPGFYDHRALISDASEAMAYSATISIGHLVVAVVGPTTEPIDHISRGPVDRHLRRVWPTAKKPLTFPFSRALTTRELDGLAGPPAPHYDAG